ncbi:Development/cell death domain-containing protein [Hirschfeldia incana]|nr:Development/cell death domain-containing protein [Hirschfeldia incana]
MAEAMETEMDFSDGEQTNNANRASLVALYGNSSIGLEKGIQQQPGYIFMCNGRTKQDCFRYRVFGIPRGGRNVVERIRPGMKLFLYDFEKRLLYGVYEATVGGKLDIEPDAFERKYPAQVGFRIVDNCYPLPESTFKSAIYENYKGGKFNQELAPHQVGSLLSLFRSFAAPQLDALPHRFASGASAASRELSFEERFIAATQLKNASSVLDPLSARHAEPRLGSLMDRQSVVPRSHLLHNSYSRQDDYTTPVRETPSRSSSIQDPQLKYLTILSNIRRYGTAPEPLASENEYHPATQSEKEQFTSPYSDKKHYLSTLPGNEHSSAGAANGNLYRGELYTSASQKEGEASQQHETLAGTYYQPEASTVPNTTASMQAVNAATAGYPTTAHGEATQLAAGATDYAYKPQTVTGNYYTTAHSQHGSVGENAESYAGAVSYPPQQHTQLYTGGPGYTQQPHETAYAQQHYSAATGYAQQNHAAATGYAMRPQDAAATGYAQQPQDAAATGYAQQSYDAATGYALQAHAATTGYTQQLQDAATGYAQQPQDAAAGYALQQHAQTVGYTTQPHAQAVGYTPQYGAQAVGYTPQYGAQEGGYTTQYGAQAVGYSATQAGAYSQQAVTQGSVPGAQTTTDWNAASRAYSAAGEWNAVNQSYYYQTADTTTTYNQTS